MKLQTLRGTRDFLPEEARNREKVFALLKSIFRKYGFEPLNSPAIEYAEVLEGKYGDEEKLIWKFKDKGGRDVALRYDLTVPLARIVASNPQLQMPFKRYCISRVWRYDRPSKGRYREFWQCDIDTVGVKSVLADAEMIAVTSEIMNTLGFRKFMIRINNRKLLNALIQYAGVDSGKAVDVFRAVDKLDKIGMDGVKKELEAGKVPEKSSRKILEIIEIKGGKEVLEKLEKIIKTGEGKEGLNEMKELLEYLDSFGVKKTDYVIDMSLVRGLDYYTGLIYETIVEKPKIGSLTGGGRYDRMIGSLSGKDIPATGTSFGIERIIDVMKELRMTDDKDSDFDYCVAPVSSDVLKDAIRIAQKLRAKGKKVSLDLMGRSLGKQLNYANKKRIKKVIVVGPKELKEKKVVVKDMESGKETITKIKAL